MFHHPIILSGLNPSTYYDIYVRANCGSGAFNSWAGPVSFQTACGILVAPVVENFDNTMDWYSSGLKFWKYHWYLLDGNSGYVEFNAF